MLAGTVDARERLFVEQTDQPVAVGDFAQDLHHEHVVVAGEIQLLEHRRQLELGRGDFIVAGLGRNAELPEFLFDFGHEIQDAHFDRTEVVVLKLLVLRRGRAEHGAAGLHEVGALVVEVLVDQEVLLFGAEGDLHIRLFLAEVLHQPFHRGRKRLHRAQQRGLLVERLAGVAAEGGRDAQGRAVAVPLDESRAGRVPRGVAARFEGGAQSARREA